MLCQLRNSVNPSAYKHGDIKSVIDDESGTLQDSKCSTPLEMRRKPSKLLQTPQKQNSAQS